MEEGNEANKCCDCCDKNVRFILNVDVILGIIWPCPPAVCTPLLKGKG